MLRLVRVAGLSMAPRFLPGRLLWVESLTYRFRAPRRGEIVLVRPPGYAFRIVKRVAAVPGDEVGGRVLAADEYFVVGDHADASTDSRTFGPVSRQALAWRAIARRRRGGRQGPAPKMSVRCKGF